MPAAYSHAVVTLEVEGCRTDFIMRNLAVLAFAVGLHKAEVKACWAGAHRTKVGTQC